MPTVVEVQGVAKRFGEIRAVAGVDFAVHEGEVFGLIGHNGAGKSTLIRMILGLLAPDAGTIRIDGQPIAGPGFLAPCAGASPTCPKTSCSYLLQPL